MKNALNCELTNSVHFMLFISLSYPLPINEKFSQNYTGTQFRYGLSENQRFSRRETDTKKNNSQFTFAGV